MSAETLRRAASLMRLRAEAAAQKAPAPWVVDGEVAASLPAPFGVVYRNDHGAPVSVAETYSDIEAAHIASWHPAVALAVADWLDACALVEEIAPNRIKANALTVARAYLGVTP